MKFYLILIALSLLAGAQAHAASVTLTSPNGRLTVVVDDKDSQPSYRVSLDGKALLGASRLGLSFVQQPDMTEGLSIVLLDKNSVDETWEQPWGERQFIRENYNEALIAMHRNTSPALQLNVRFRVFDDGIGFRYEMPEQGKIERVDVTADFSQFNLTDASTTNALHIFSEQWNRYEHIYRQVPASDVYTAATPITFKRVDGIYLSIHEAALVDWAGFSLVQRHNPGILQAKLTPWSDGIAVKSKLPFKSSWRTLQVADNAPALLNSNLILNLNEANKLGDVSWVHPGKYTGIWWEMHRGDRTWGSGEYHGATNDNVKARIDFAAKYGFDGVLVEGWNTGWDGDWINNGGLFSFTQSYDDFDLAMLSQYGAERGVKIIGHHETSGNVENYKAQMGDAYDFYAKYGVEQIKTGYVAWAQELIRYDDKGLKRFEWHDGQWSVNEYLRTVTEAAKRHIAINTHEPVKDTGLRRTYPNWIAREGARGQEFNSPGSGGTDGNGVNPPDHNLALAFTRMLSGPMDFTPGIFDLQYDGKDTNTVIKSTLAHQLALYVVLYSPIQMVPDYQAHYEKHLDAFQFIVDVPTDWQQSIALSGDIGDHVAWARKERDGDDWYLGAISGNDARQLVIDLDFLDTDSQYLAEIYRDGDNADWRSAPLDYVIEHKPVQRGDQLNVRLVEAGGLAVRFKKQ